MLHVRYPERGAGAKPSGGHAAWRRTRGKLLAQPAELVVVDAIGRWGDGHSVLRVLGPVAGAVVRPAPFGPDGEAACRVSLVIEMPREPRVEDEVQSIEAALHALNCALEGLRSAAEAVDRQLEETADALVKPNCRRAQSQLRMALNATVGAQQSLRRRLALRRGLLNRAARAAAPNTPPRRA